MGEDLEDQQDFFDKVVITEGGKLGTVNVTKTGAEVKPLTAGEFFNKVALDENGNIKTYI